MVTHDQIRDELVRRLEGKSVSAKEVADLLGIHPTRVTEVRYGRRRIQQDEMPVLAQFFGMNTEADLSGRTEAEPNTVLPPRYVDLPRDIPVFGTAIGTFSEDERIEQTIVNRDETIDYFIRPPGIANRKGVYGLYVSGESQSPRFRQGELIFVDPSRAPLIGDDVVVYIRKPDGDGEDLAAVLLKQLTKRSASLIGLHQLNPATDFTVDSRKVMAIHRVLTNADLYGGYR